MTWIVWDVCRGKQFAPWIAGRLGIGLLFFCYGALLALRFLRDWRGWMGFGVAMLGFVILLAPVPWDLGPCPASKSDSKTEHRQSFQHENFIAAVGLHFAYYNFVKRHNTLKTTPAVAAGVTGEPWTVGDLLEAAK